jgi:hypothetical protein
MKKALCIGINYYNTNAKLNGCIGDVVNMRHLLVDAFGFSLANITTLRDDTTNSAILPTKANILRCLNQIVADSANCKEIWIHYSGHGSLVSDTNGDEVSKQDQVIVPSDYRTAGLIIDDELYAILKNVKCKTVLLFDCCNSGTVVDLPWSFIYQNPGSYRIQQNNKYALANTEIFMFSGCRDDQTSADAYSLDQQQAVGAFTNAFISCIRARNHEVSFLTLYRDICMFLAANRFTQVPVFSSSTMTPKFALSRTAQITNSTPTVPSVLPSVFANNKVVRLRMAF